MLRWQLECSGPGSSIYESEGEKEVKKIMIKKRGGWLCAECESRAEWSV